MKSPADSESAEGTIKEEVLREFSKFLIKRGYHTLRDKEEDEKLVDLAIQKTLAKAEKIIDGEKASWERFYEKKASHLNVTLNAIIRSLDLAKQRISEIKMGGENG